MAKCNDCWCEHYDKSRGNCDRCKKKETEKSKPVLAVLLKDRAAKQMQLDENKKSKGQIR